MFCVPVCQLTLVELTLLMCETIVSRVKNETLDKYVTQLVINVLFGIFFATIFVMPLVFVAIVWKLDFGIVSLTFLGMYWWVFGVCRAYRNPLN